MLFALRIRNHILIFWKFHWFSTVDLDISSFYDFFIIDLAYYLLQIDLWLKFKPSNFYHSLCNFILQLLGCCICFQFS
jgi:hypothetical protein